jgi:beta-phosphoglucomutase-like phosphatase (HAD superfamily)
MQNLQRSGFAPYFDVLVTGDMVKCGKPHPETFLMAAELLGVLPEHCMGVEDSFHGVRAIHDAGMFTVMVPDMHQPDASVLPLIDAVCENLFEIQHLVEKINRCE